jgi:hypothetical protein
LRSHDEVSHEGAFVTVSRRLRVFVVGSAAATLGFAVLQSLPARAEDILPAASRTDTADLRPHLKTAPLLNADDAYTTPARRVNAPVDGSEGDPSNPAQIDDSFGSDPVTSPEASPSDADTSAGTEPAPDQDGTLDAAEPEPPQDGADPTQDTRPPADIAVFESPPAGFDPLLFQIEDIDPLLTDRRPERLFRLEPYDPIGIRIGSFVLFPEAEIAGIATSNVQSTSGGNPDVGLGLQSKARLVSNWSRHAIELRGTTVNTYYDEYSSEDDRDWSAEARGRLDIAQRTNIQGLVGHDFGQESRSDIDAVVVGPRPNVATDRAAAAFNHRFNRVTVQLRGALTDTKYSDTGGATGSLDYRDSNVTEEAVRLSYELKPTLAVFTETALNQRDYDGVSPEDDLTRNSKGERYRLGLDLGGTSPIWRGEVSIGYGNQKSKATELGDVAAFLVDANLTWRPTEITALLFTAKTDIDTTTTEGSPGVISRQAGIEVRHAFRRYVVASAGLTYTDYDYTHVSLHERDLETNVGVEYYASPELVLFTRYLHVDFNSNLPEGDYNENEIRVGARLRR